jgi:drug/metabolite transporter (DMT)-like permease
MALAASLYALMNLGARLSSAHTSWAEVALVRAMVGALVAWGVASARGASLVLQDKKLAWGRSLAGAASAVCTFYALGAPTLPLGDAVTLRESSPVFIALAAPRLLGERSGTRTWMAIGVAFAGVILVLRPSLDFAPGPALVAILAAVLAAGAMMFLRRLGPKESPEAVALHFSVVTSCVMFVFAWPAFVVPDLKGALLLVGTGLSGGLAQLAMTRAYSLDVAARVGAIGYLDVVVSQLLAVLLLGDRPGAGQLVGSGLVIASGVILALGAVRSGGAVNAGS